MKREKLGTIIKSIQENNEERLNTMFPEVEFGTSYKEILKGFYKDEIIEIAENWNLKGVKSLNKEKIIEKLENHIKENISNLILFLDSEIIEIIKKIIKNEGSLDALKLYTDIIDYFTGKGIAFTIKNSDSYYVYMPKEIADSIKIDVTKSFKEAIEKNDRSLNYLKGLMINYGTLDREKLFVMMDEFTNNISDSENKWRDAASEYLIYDSFFHSYESCFSVIADEKSADVIINEQFSRKDIEYFEFTEEELIESGKSGNPILTEVQREVISVLNSNVKKNSVKIEEIIYDTISAINYGGKYTNIMEELFKILEIDSKSEYNGKNFIHYFTEFCNNTRQWVLKGNSSNEVFNGNSSVLKMAAENHFKVIKGGKVGRNDVCPCGSGKKHKKCCGKDTI